MSSAILERDHVATEAPLHVTGVGLFVRDLDRVAAFYRDVVGLALIRREDGAAQLGADGIPFLHLLHRPDALPDDPESAGLFHTAFLLPSRADLGRWLVHARDSSIRVEGAADHLVSEAVYLTDPEGNGIEIYADRPARDWSWTGPAEARQLKMANAPLDFAGLIAAAGTRWAGAPAGTCIGHVHLRVGNVAEAVTFYTTMLGFDVTRAMPEAAFLSTGGYHHHVAANVWRSPGVGLRDPRRAGLAWVAFGATDQAVIDDIARRSATPDVAATGLRDPWGTRLTVSVEPCKESLS